MKNILLWLAMFAVCSCGNSNSPPAAGKETGIHIATTHPTPVDTDSLAKIARTIPRLPQHAENLLLGNWINNKLMRALQTGVLDSNTKTWTNPWRSIGIEKKPDGRINCYLEFSFEGVYEQPGMVFTYKKASDSLFFVNLQLRQNNYSQDLLLNTTDTTLLIIRDNAAKLAEVKNEIFVKGAAYAGSSIYQLTQEKLLQGMFNVFNVPESRAISSTAEFKKGKVANFPGIDFYQAADIYLLKDSVAGQYFLVNLQETNYAYKRIKDDLIHLYSFEWINPGDKNEKIKSVRLKYVLTRLPAGKTTQL